MSALILQSMTWEGQRLAIVLHDHAEDLRLVVLLDGLYFSERSVPAHERELHFDFPFAPNGHTDLVFSLRLEPQDIELLPAPRRVRFGVAESASSVASMPFEKSADADCAQKLAPLLDATIFSPLQQPDDLHAPVTIIVPIFNAAEHVQRCIDALIAHTQAAARLLLIDDASTDPAIAPLLARYQDTAGIVVLHNPQNLGYTRTIALALSQTPDGDVVVLNADTEVGPNWLLGLRRAAYARADIGTATAVSDNAGAFSVPELEQNNSLPTRLSLPQTQRALWQHAGLVAPALPTGNGFCMYVKRAMLDRVGGPDVDAFPQGYGEENDWCQRAEQFGFAHVIAGNVLVRHARSASFGDARRESLGRAGMTVLRERYPHYEAAVGATLFSFERRVLDWRVRHVYRTALRIASLPRPRVVWISTSENDALADVEILARDFDIWKLSCDGDGLILMQYSATGWREMQHTIIAPCIEFAAASWLRYDELFASWLQHYAIELVHVIDARGHSGHLSGISHSLGVPLLDESRVQTRSADADHLAQSYNAALNRQCSFAAIPIQQ